MAVYWEEPEEKKEQMSEWFERTFPSAMGLFGFALSGACFMFSWLHRRWDLACVGGVALFAACAFWAEAAAIEKGEGNDGRG